ncbi:MAG: hypothetical protein WA006_01865 [Rhodoglobus sp.]
MALEDHPNVFRYEGRTWVSLAPRDEARAALAAQRAWDAATARAQRWWVAIAIGAVLGAMVNKRFNPGAGAAQATERTGVPELTRVPASLAHRISDDATAAEIIERARR